MASENWRKSSHSTGQGGNCVEVASASEHIAVRDTTDRDGGTLVIGAAAWAAFLKSI